jgi:hypothetical protein
MNGQQPERMRKAHADVVEQQLMEEVDKLRTGLALQVKIFPAAGPALSRLIQTWIDEAELALIAYHETGIAPAIDIEALTAQAKRRYMEELLIVQQCYPSLPIDDAYKKMCFAIDMYYPDRLQKLIDERNAQQ